MVLEPMRKNFKSPLQIKETVEKIKYQEPYVQTNGFWMISLHLYSFHIIGAQFSR
jgi:hypothetical protein